MRVYDGLQRFELSVARDSAEVPGLDIGGQEFANALRHAPRESLERIADFLVRDFGWMPTDSGRHEAAIERLVELIALGRVRVAAFRPSGSIAGDVPDEDDVQDLSALASEEEDAMDAAVVIEAPMGIEPESELEPPVGFEADFEVADPEMPEFDFEMG